MDAKMKVLVVDDDQHMVKTICDILRIKGHDPYQAFDGEQAVSKVRANRFDCVLMDVKMPGVDGVEALGLMKEAVPGLPVVLMSANSTERQAVTAQRRGALALLTKPVDIRKILHFLSQLSEEERILFVRRASPSCAPLDEILLARGYRVETESDPERVLSRLAEHYEILVLLDSGQGGEETEVFNEIRRNYPNTQVLLVSGCGARNPPRETAPQAGGCTGICNWLERDRLLPLIEQIIRGKLRTLLGEPFDSPPLAADSG